MGRIMSRIGKLPIAVDSSVQVILKGNHLKVKGKNGKLEKVFAKEISLSFADGKITVQPIDKNNMRTRAIWGLSRTLIANMIKGVHEGWTERLEITGVGYKAAVSNGMLVLSLGYSHDIMYAFPQGIEIKCEKPTSISISGADKQLVGQVAAEIRQLRKPEPYKGKGIRYATENIRRKENKKK
ncbi:MAG: 50S ribosomal protein L6 [Candidatus Midichloria sp.]|nr:MAG: 50S ribosomal protein L6 [Candidatus Midichloria sp.]